MSGRLSVCIIARNEAGRIERCLESVRDVADQIIVVDSGSTDSTVEISTRAGAQIVHHVWSDDFSAARNAALPHIQCKWVLWIDADERLLPNSRDELRAMVQRDDVLAATIVRRDYITGEGKRQFAATHLLRFMRADCGIGWTGRCHEQPDPSVNELADRLGLKLLASRIVLDHDADYFGPGRIEKQKRNARLLEMEIKERPDRLYYVIQCAAALQDLNDPRGPELMTQAIMKLAQQKHEAKAPLPIAMLALEFAMLGRAPSVLSREDAVALAEKWFADAAPVIWQRAARYFSAGDYANAATDLRRLIEMGKQHTYNLDVAFDPLIIGDDARINLAACLVRQCELDEAESVLNEVEPKSQRFAAAQKNLQAIRSIRQIALE